MKIYLLIFALFLSSCGTLGGLANGAGEVLEGAAYDVSSIGSLLIPKIAKRYISFFLQEYFFSVRLLVIT